MAGVTPADRPASPEAGAIILAALIAPISPFLLYLTIGLSLGDDIAALEEQFAHPRMQEVSSYITEVCRDPKRMAVYACVVAWLGVVPAMLVLRTARLLSFRTALPAAILIPLSTVSTIVLLFWKSTSATTTEKFIIYGMLVGATVPAALAAAVAFWAVYALVSGRADGLRSRSRREVPRETN